MLHDARSRTPLFGNRSRLSVLFAAALAGLFVTAASAGEVAGGPFSASGVELLAWIQPSEFPINSPGNDVWGYTSPSGRQYIIMGMHQGTGFVEVTDPNNVTIVDFVAGGNTSTWRDMKVYDHYCYAVKDGDSMMLQVMDLSDIDNGNVTLVNTTDLGSGFTRAHNIAINEASGYGYLVGSNLGGGGIVVIDLATDPVNPTIVGNWGDSGAHDALIITYDEGPFAGSEICFLFAYGNGMIVLDVTDKDNIVVRDQLIYPNVSICHQGWVSEDRQYLFIGDEGDENPMTTTTYVADISDLDNVSLVTTFTNGLPAIDHNMMVRGDYLYEANYASGLRIFNIADVNNVVEVGFFDTYPEHDNPGFPGAWAPYVGFPGSIVAVNDRNRGLFILDASAAIGAEPAAAARPAPDPYFNNECNIHACSVDGECEGESICVPDADGNFPGTCYVPRNRFLGVAFNPENNGVATARRVSVERDGDTDLVLGWVGQPESRNLTGPECVQLGNTQYIAEIVDTPFYANWNAVGGDVVHVGDCHVSPGHTYKVQAIALGADTADEGAYSAPLVLTTPSLWADVSGGGAVSSPPNGSANLVDVSLIVFGFQGIQTAPKSWLELEGSGGQPDHSVVNLADAFRAVQGFQGLPYPFDDPCTCAGLAPCP